MTTLLLSDLTANLASISDTPALDASVLVAQIVNKPRTWVMAHPELTLTTEQQIKLDNSLAHLKRGESFPYVLGRWDFFGLEFDITPDVLIPRPETELLVEKANTWLRRNPYQRNIADVGTGSGAIAVSIAINIPNASILATDISSKALQVAKRNAEKHRVGKMIEFVECNLLPKESNFADRKSKIDLLCANLPYIPTETLRSLPVFRSEPTLALDGGADGLELIRKLMAMAPEWMAPNSIMLFEIESTLGKQAMRLAHDMFPTAIVQLHRDLSDCDRLLQIDLS